MHIIDILLYHIMFLFLIVYDILLGFKGRHMQVYKRYMIEYSTIFTLLCQSGSCSEIYKLYDKNEDKHVTPQRRTVDKGISILLLVETNFALSKAIQNHDADFLHLPLRNKDRTLAHTCNFSFRYENYVHSLINSRIADKLHRIYPN